MSLKTVKKGADFEAKKRWLKRYLKSVEKLNRLFDREWEIVRHGNMSDHDRSILTQIDHEKADIRRSMNVSHSEIHHAAENLNDEIETQVLILYFINGHSFKQIADMLHYSERQIIRYYVSGINNAEIKGVSEM